MKWKMPERNEFNYNLWKNIKIKKNRISLGAGTGTYWEWWPGLLGARAELPREIFGILGAWGPLRVTPETFRAKALMVTRISGCQITFQVRLKALQEGQKLWHEFEKLAARHFSFARLKAQIEVSAM